MNKLKINLARGLTGLMMAAIIAVPSVHALTSSDIELLISLGIIPADKVESARAAFGQKDSCGSFTRNLTLGSTGSDVVSLQTFLESKGKLTIPVGVSKGYFGPLTRNALGMYQASVGIAPTAGYFGPITRADVSAKCGPTTPVTPPANNDDLKGDEALLKKFDLSSGDDSNVEENKSADIAEIKFDVEDGDIILDRIDLVFVNASSTDTTDPWDALESVELVVKGKVVGKADLSDEDSYIDEDAGIVRISRINTKFKKGDQAKIIVRITGQKTIRTEHQDTFKVNVLNDGIRATDAKKIQQYIGLASDKVSFDVVIAGDGEDLKVSSSKENPNATTLKIESNKKSSLHDIFAFELESKESDIRLEKVRIDIETSAITSKMIADLELEIDGKEFTKWSYVSGGNGTSTRTVEFDVNKKFTLDADDKVTVILSAKFNAANGSNYSSGETVSAKISSNAINGRGANRILSSGSTNGKTHTLATEGVVVGKSGFSDKGSSATNVSNTIREFKFTFDVAAFEEDFYVATSSVNIFVEGAQGATSVHSYTVDSTGDEDSIGVFTVRRGETETFTVVVVVDADATGQFRVGLDSIDYTTNSDGFTGLLNKDVTNSEFRTAYSTINN